LDFPNISAERNEAIHSVVMGFGNFIVAFF